jgi:hypothetical protein
MIYKAKLRYYLIIFQHVFSFGWISEFKAENKLTIPIVSIICS